MIAFIAFKVVCWAASVLFVMLAGFILHAVYDAIWDASSVFGEIATIITLVAMTVGLIAAFVCFISSGWAAYFLL